MKNILKIFTIILLTFIFSCGKKGSLECKDCKKQPSFDKVFDRGKVK